MMILTIPNLSDDAINLLRSQVIIGIFTGAFVASPTIGYIIYGFYNHLYEHWAMKKEWRGALRYIENLEFVGDEKHKKRYKRMLRCDIQKKEFLDLIYHSTLEKNGEIKIDPKIFETLKNNLSAFAARVVCGFFVPVIFCIPSYFLVWYTLSLFGLNFTWRGWFPLPSIAIIFLLSIVLILDCKRVLYEAYQLEEYLVKVRRKEIKELLGKLFTSGKSNLDTEVRS